MEANIETEASSHRVSDHQSPIYFVDGTENFNEITTHAFRFFRFLDSIDCSAISADALHEALAIRTRLISLLVTHNAQEQFGGNKMILALSIFSIIYRTELCYR